MQLERKDDEGEVSSKDRRRGRLVGVGLARPTRDLPIHSRCMKHCKYLYLVDVTKRYRKDEA